MLRTCLFAATLLLGSAACVFASVDQELLAMAPPETTLLTGIDVPKVSNSPFGQHVLNGTGQDRRFHDLMTAAGFDPRRDLQQVLLAGVAGKNGPDSRFALLARGNFDVGKISGAARQKGLKVSTVNGITLLTSSTNGGKDMAFAFPHPGIAVTGDLPTVREILGGTSAGSLDPELSRQVSEVGPGNDIWFATLLSGNAIGNDLPLGGGSNQQLFNTQLLRSIKQSSGGIQFGSTVSMAIHLLTGSEADAQSVSDLLRFAGNMVQMKQGDDPHLQAIAAALNTMQLNTSGPRVNASLAMDERVLELFIDQRSAPLAN